MKEFIDIAPNTYIEYEIDDGYISIPSLYIIHNGEINSELNNNYSKGILACLIEQHKKGGDFLQKI